MDDDNLGAPPPEDDGGAGDGFFLMEGWMFGALMYPLATEHMRQFPAANDRGGD